MPGPYSPPARTALVDTYPNPSNAVAKAGFGALYDYVTGMPLGQCRLVKSGANVVLQRYNGLWLTINGSVYLIPSAGVTLTPSSLTAGTTYYIYAYMVGATMTLEASTTGHSTDAASGMEIKTGDATRSLVGMARVVSGPAFQDTAIQRFVSSWFNRRPLELKNPLTANQGNAGTSYAEITSSLRAEFLLWSGDFSTHVFSGYLTNNVGGVFAATGLALDGTLMDGTSQIVIGTSVSPYPFTCRGTSGAAAEGYHYVTPFARQTTTSTSTYAGAASAGDRCVNAGSVMG